ncbi:MAG: DegT/DnrJ/EryC1/StrS aminotransferase family enzyme [Candidatus Gottesmanbacteria bacterium GW2011_GWB1_43_11]|uniref:DegT/DnrJ/EryC1/StrS aminotransferase family enzyme n=1 Tax=Candidatus Gottesmanbacteria bacterium GW2011_GWB1_43_11 TaxID=1618446 RepID=A0A0G1CPJ7_9BACT|nr:MAG: DegT/DnrJ/EryC1/StrS aminotransferase family enzyme [Candidatus Gottesmanbacteria bacterium GW2011_GWA2_42_16]KKS56272.1 MAG: DegT/DnrJ/EryC1/StrS aminotransferase family enzyme [Candidatus Gottesmanbacteria bacterium GW2011_GWA1_42_26]KKS82605.1 MAG: DegT/DnrJ/EryC1/StrS aminotransferase family enzyme [Candidatus Gottesmanbacteria bacterium GW2011_GWC1_43_10]KKS87474.1 MAG: DegT/DnrJ/EryC1/StrS aminotransferase family enzyme [Candidatus Gottesmanbacteria bacterium GW2011_GWB1_43_11]OGG
MDRRLRESIKQHFKNKFPPPKFKPGITPVPVSGKVFDEQELLKGVAAVLDGWWTEGHFAQGFEKAFAKLTGVRYVTLVNSGSSANLIALSSLTAKVFGERALKAGDEVITAATGFPTTVNPILQNGCVPVFVDNDLETKNATLTSIKKAISVKTKAIMMAHTLGNPLPIAGILELAQKYKLWFIEDCCDALGSRYKNKLVGAFGHLATFSFYPAHQITMGEGGAVITSNPLIFRALRQFRDWGRDCWCDTGKDNTCRRRFGWQMGELPAGYDHKYIYSQIGYNLKLTDMQAAIGLSQLRKLPRFVKARQNNFKELSDFFEQYERFFICSKSEPESKPCWFGFMLVIRDGAPFTRLDIVNYLEDKHIATRSLFGGNLLRHPAYLKRSGMRVIGQLMNSDKIMRDGFWIGVYPGIGKPQLSYIKKCFSDFLEKFVT